MNTIKLGDTVRDTVTGYTGVVTCEIRHITGERELEIIHPVYAAFLACSCNTW